MNNWNNCKRNCAEIKQTVNATWGCICKKWLNWVCANSWARVNVKQGVSGKAGFICIIKVDTTHIDQMWKKQFEQLWHHEVDLSQSYVSLR